MLGTIWEEVAENECPMVEEPQLVTIIVEENPDTTGSEVEAYHPCGSVVEVKQVCSEDEEETRGRPRSRS